MKIDADEKELLLMQIPTAVGSPVARSRKASLTGRRGTALRRWDGNRNSMRHTPIPGSSPGPCRS